MKLLSKNIFSVLLIIGVSVLFIACSNQNDEKDSKDSNSENKSALPSGDINTMIPVAAGGGTDLTHRGLAEVVEKYLDRNVVVNNVEGSGGSVGFSTASKFEPNGLHLFSFTSEIFTLPIYQGDPGYKPEDFKPLVLISEEPAAIVVSADSKYDTLEDFMKEAEENPGKVSIGNSGFGNIWHLSAAQFEKETGLDFKQIPYDGASETVQDALGGHLDAFVASPPEVASQVEAGKLKILAVMSDERIDTFPEIPTLKEQGINISMGTWRGLGVPAETPDDVVKALADAYSEAINSDEFKQFMEEQQMNIRFMNNEDFVEFVESERPVFEELAKEVKQTEDE